MLPWEQSLLSELALQESFFRAQSIGVQARRALLQTDSGAAAAAKQGNLYNVATVTLEANCSSEQAVPATLTEMQSVMDKGILAVGHH